MHGSYELIFMIYRLLPKSKFVSSQNTSFLNSSKSCESIQVLRLATHIVDDIIYRYQRLKWNPNFQLIKYSSRQLKR